MKFALATLGLLLTLNTGCTPRDGSVVRLVRGRQVPGRFVTPAAYANYTQGAYLEALGKNRAAAKSYLSALDDDPASPELWTRLGATRCAAGLPGVWNALDHALEIDPDYEPAWRARARCHLGQDRAAQAKKDALHALTLDPAVAETTLLLAEVFEKEGDRAAAQRWLEALVTRNPSSREAWTALKEVAARAHDDATRIRAALVLARLEHRSAQSLGEEDRTLDPRRRVDAALAAGELAEARARALRARMTPARLAIRAVQLGKPKLARAQALLVLEADPSSSDARIALLATSSPDDTRANELALGRLWAAPLSPSPEGAKLLAFVLTARVGERARDAWTSSYERVVLKARPLAPAGASQPSQPPAGRDTR